MSSYCERPGAVRSNWLTGYGFGSDDGASLLMAFRGLQAESVEQGRVHKAIAQELQDLVADPFDEWAQRYKVRVSVPDCQRAFSRTASQERLGQNRSTVVGDWLGSYEHAQGEVSETCLTFHYIRN